MCRGQALPCKLKSDSKHRVIEARHTRTRETSIQRGAALIGISEAAILIGGAAAKIYLK
jgi:hypothetical protein